ncbi:hypothetical protein MSG28_003304 [Choristoneura fumiferana]|uniref:Uncharacterized protein n=1 Tax=Choristoneura fumiferana TaxID=7141 RepID=A0ACC0KFD6_CHOFU|nr:hypothetical protein MSG28_003304 [Choristoneura fumiferana]
MLGLKISSAALVLIVLISLCLGPEATAAPSPSASPDVKAPVSPPLISPPSVVANTTAPPFGNVITVPTNCPEGKQLINNECKDV